MEAVALQQRRKCIARRMATCVGMLVKPVIDARQFRELMALPVGTLAVLLVDPRGTSAAPLPALTQPIIVA